MISIYFPIYTPRSIYRSVYLIISYRSACAIPDQDNQEVVITGGIETLATVSVYKEFGWKGDLPSLNQGRYWHACSYYIFRGERVREALKIKNPLGSILIVSAMLQIPLFGACF